MKVGFIGVGEQGAPMAERVLGAGHELLVYARRPEVRAHFAQLGADRQQSLSFGIHYAGPMMGFADIDAHPRFISLCVHASPSVGPGC
jgi:predicted dinucleotide-binding enzyme